MNEWQPIESCPFSAHPDIWISDGSSVLHARVTDRLGHGMPLLVVLGEISWPEWRHEWRLVNEDAHESERFGKPEVDIYYTPKYWMPMAGRPNAPV